MLSFLDSCSLSIYLSISLSLSLSLSQVSVGELGTNTTQLEASLRQILDVASV